MIPIRTFEGKKVAVFGLARSGLAAAEALTLGGAKVFVWDDNEAQQKAALEVGATVENLYEADWSTFDACILSPGIPLTHPAPHAVVLKAQSQNVEVIGDIELFVREYRARETSDLLIGITGTNGKSTTTSLIGHIIREAHSFCDVGGNIGEPVLALSDFSKSKRHYVLEISSYQLDLAPSLKPRTAVLLNISPDHLDRHGGMDGYISSKRKIFANQDASDTAIISVDDPYAAEICSDISRNGVGRVIPISVGKTLSKGVYVVDGILFDALETPSAEVIDLHECENLKGAHNWQNAAAAYAAARAEGVPRDIIVSALKSFQGLPHRLETIGLVNGVRFVNDSKATNVDAAAFALASFENLYWIAGGRAKANSLEPITQHKDNIRRAYLIGEAAQEFSRSLEGAVDCVLSGALTNAVQSAYEDAQRDQRTEPVVLLSPACSSFDQFSDFEDRGNKFRDAVEDLMSHNTRGGAAA